MLSITRNEFNHVVLTCRSEQNCTHLKVIRSLGITNELLYAETPEWLISQLQRAAAQLLSLVGDAAENESGEVSPASESGRVTAGDSTHPPSNPFTPGPSVPPNPGPPVISE